VAETGALSSRPDRAQDEVAHASIDADMSELAAIGAIVAAEIQVLQYPYEIFARHVLVERGWRLFEVPVVQACCHG
jgi:hypothetical protein